MKMGGINFEFATASRIIFGNGKVEKLPELINGLGDGVLIVTGKNYERNRRLLAKIKKENWKVVSFQVPREPDINLINEGIDIARVEGCNVVVGIGGGSVIDSAKAIAAMVPNKGELLDYLEVIGQGRPLTEDPLPFIAVPTTAGTGAEVTKNSVIKSEEHMVKVSLRSNKMYPDIALVDPVLTYSMPPKLTAATGIDALTHLLEAFVSNQANSFTDMICREGLRLISKSLIESYLNGKNESARENMSTASLFGGLALANCKLGAVHGFAGPMGGMFPAHHGEICASLLPAVMEVNFEVLKKEANGRLKKFEELATILTGNSEAKIEEAIGWIKNLIQRMNIPRLNYFGIEKEDFPELVRKAKNSSSMKGNPVVLKEQELTAVLMLAY